MADDSSRAVCFTLWSSTHNNCRYADLFRRLEGRVKFHRVTLSANPLLRAMQYRTWRLLRDKLIYPQVLGHLAKRYDTLLSVDYAQVAKWRHEESVVVDIDDPVFTDGEIEALNLPQVKAIVVTTEKARAVFHKRGVRRPIHVIPQGVSLGDTDATRVEDIREQFKQEGDVVVGYHAPTLTLSSDGPHRMRCGVDDLDLLFHAIEAARMSEPRIQLWLVGEPSRCVRKFSAGKPWLKLFGYVPFDDVLNYVANFDIAVYPRTYTLPPGRFAVKLAQYMACGIPIVATNRDESCIVKEVSCGMVCDSPNEFGNALVEAARSAEARRELGVRGRRYAEANLEWSALVRKYEELLN